MSIVHVMDHPLIQHKLSLMRDQETGPKEFRELLNEISMLMAYEVTRDLPLKTIEIETPICRAQTQVIAGKKLAIVPILRAGLGMVDGIMSLVPPRRSAISAFTATRTPLSRWNTTASFRPMHRSAKFCWSIRCWQPAALPLRRSASSRSAAARTSSSSI